MRGSGAQRRRSARSAPLAIALLAAVAGAHAQELEPRAYSPSPVGTNFFAVAAGRSSGDVLFDPTVPITDARANVDLAAIGYGRSYGLAGRQGVFAVLLPIAVAHARGLVGEESRTARRAGLADLRVRASLNLVGTKALTPREFASAPQRTIFGVSLTVQAPTGQYDRTKLLNLGTNRWAFKPELGVSVPYRRWTFDAYAGAWFFTNNDAFYPGGSVKRQDPLASVQAHVSYTFENKAWLAFDATWYGGGASVVDAGSPSTRFSNSRAGGTLSIPVAKRQSIKLAASKGASSRTGTDFATLVVGWQFLWFDRPRAGRH